MTKLLTIFGNEFDDRGHVTVAHVGGIVFWISGKDSDVSAFVNGRRVGGTFPTKEAARGALESEGRRISREMLMMAGEMVAEKTYNAYCTDGSYKTVEQVPVKFKGSIP